jgi:hypothetical protein
MQKLQLVHSWHGVPGSKLDCKAPDIAHGNPFVVIISDAEKSWSSPHFLFCDQQLIIISDPSLNVVVCLLGAGLPQANC